MNEESLKRIVASLSRAIGNDLLAYEKKEDSWELSIWSPILPSEKKLLNDFIRSSLGPRVKVRINSKRGKIVISKKK